MSDRVDNEKVKFPGFPCRVIKNEVLAWENQPPALEVDFKEAPMGFLRGESSTVYRALRTHERSAGAL